MLLSSNVVFQVIYIYVSSKLFFRLAINIFIYHCHECHLDIIDRNKKYHYQALQELGLIMRHIPKFKDWQYFKLHMYDSIIYY